MNPKLHILYLFTFLIFCNNVISQAVKNINTNSKCLCKEKLNVPFGTIVKLKVEIIDGDQTKRASQRGHFLMKVLQINEQKINEPIIFWFKDETNNFPTGQFELFEHLYGEKTGMLTEKQLIKMKTGYVGKEFDIIAYETGEFTGIPDGYFDYQPVKSGVGFYFRNYLIVISNVTSK